MPLLLWNQLICLQNLIDNPRKRIQLWATYSYLAGFAPYRSGSFYFR
jgi:hypothetical protein